MAGSSMKILTLIPSAGTYGIVLLAVLSFGSFNCARHIHLRWLHKNLSYVGSNAMIKMIITLLGLLIIPMEQLFSFNLYHELSGLILGFIFGIMTLLIETRMIRNCNRKLLVNKIVRAQPKIISNVNWQIAKIERKLSLFSSPRNMHAKGLITIRQGIDYHMRSPNFLAYSILAVIMVAIAEEFLFRGYLISIALAMKNYTIVLIISSILIFSFSHVSHSWSEFRLKLPLSISTTLSFLITGTLLSPIIIHIMANLYAYSIKNLYRAKLLPNLHDQT
jgi:hypothetical protein